MHSDGVIKYRSYPYVRGALSNKGLRDVARRCARYDDTHGDLAVMKFEPLTSDPRLLGLSYRQIAATFRELADLREGKSK